MSRIILYGIPNCDSTKKAMQWLKKNNIPFEFHNYKTSAVSTGKLKSWINQTSLIQVLNKNSSTWKKLKPGLPDRDLTTPEAITLMQENTSLIKRPLVEMNGILLIGFQEDRYKDQFINQ